MHMMDPSSLPTFGQRNNEVQIDPSRFDYNVDGTPMSLLLTKNTGEVREWYYNNHGNFPELAIEAMAELTIEEKVKEEVKARKKQK